MLNQTRLGVGCIKFHRRGPMRVNICLPHVKIRKSVYFSIFSYYFGNSASHFLDMIILISKIGMLIRSRMEVGSITLHRRGAHEGTTCFPYVQIQKFVYILFSFIVLSNSVSHLIEMIMLISKVGMLTQTRDR